MPDTGAPWNIPYVENADLVSDWPADSLLVANAVAAGLSAAGNAGIGSAVVSTIKTDTFSTASGTYTGITGLTAAITPTTATSKILIIVQCTWSTTNANGDGVHVRLSGGNTATYIGDAGTGQIQSVFGGRITSTDNSKQSWALPATLVYLDSPATTSSTTYGVEVRHTGSGTFYLNRSSTDEASNLGSRGASSITVIEVAP